MSEHGSQFYLNPNVTRNLCDKLYDKRKIGALEIERMVKDLSQQGNLDKISQLVHFLIENFCSSSNGNHRKGGLIALAAVTIGAGDDVAPILPQVVRPVLKCFIDQDSRVRYYACEAMYNIAKVSRNQVLIFFNEIFDGLCKLSADPDQHVKSGAQLLDRLVKDIITGHEGFEITNFIPLLKERIYVINPFVRQFLIGWIGVLDSVPDFQILKYLPECLDGLFLMLSDKKKDIRREVDSTLSHFLREIQQSASLLEKTASSDNDSNSNTTNTNDNNNNQTKDKSTTDDKNDTLKSNPIPIDYGKMVTILLPHCTSKDHLTRLSALTWINEFILCGKTALLPYIPSLIGAVLPSLSFEVATIQEVALKTNDYLLNLVQTSPLDFEINSFIEIVSQQFNSELTTTRVAALRWMLVLHFKAANKLEPFLDRLFPSFMKLLNDPQEIVATIDLEVLAQITATGEYFTKLIANLVALFQEDAVLLERRCSLITRQLSLLINPEKVFRALAEQILKVEDLEFASLMIQTLNTILLTASELHDLRQSLKQLRTNEQSKKFFEILYRSWCHNPTATFSLCLLAQEYESASALVHKFAEMEITVPFLVEIDKLVQLLESPIFTSLRLQLLEPQEHPYLFKCLYGLLMLLPQSSAFVCLRARLNSVSTFGVLQPTVKKETQNKKQIDFTELLDHFQQVQNKHAAHRKQLQRENSQIFSHQTFNTTNINNNPLNKFSLIQSKNSNTSTLNRNTTT